MAELLRGHHGTERKPLGVDPRSFIPPEPVVRSVRARQISVSKRSQRGLAWPVTNVTMDPFLELVAGSVPPEKSAPWRGEETFRSDPAATATRRRLPGPSQRIEVRRTRADHMVAAMPPDIVEELEGHPDPFLKVTAHPVVVVDARPHRRSRGSEPPAAMKRERPDERLNVIRELAGQQAREVVRVVERRDEGPIRRMASAEHRLGAPTHVPTQRTIGPLDRLQSVEEMVNPNRNL